MRLHGPRTWPVQPHLRPRTWRGGPSCQCIGNNFLDFWPNTFALLTAALRLFGIIC